MADALQEMACFQGRGCGAFPRQPRARTFAGLVSRRLAALSRALDTLVIAHASLNLTVEGSRYYDACTRVLAEIEERRPGHRWRVEPQGALKVALPASFGHQQSRRSCRSSRRSIPRCSSAQPSDRSVT